MNITKYSIAMVLLLSSMISLSACGRWHQQPEPLAVNPIVVPAGVPPIKTGNFYPVSATTTADIQPVSILPPGSALANPQHTEKTQ